MTHSDPPPVYYSKILAVKPGFQVDNPAGFYDVRASFPAEGRHVPVRRVCPPHAGPDSVDAVDEPVGLPEAGFRRGRRRRCLRARSRYLARPRNPAPDLQEVTVASRHPRLTWIAGLFLFDEADREPSSTIVPEARVEFRLDPRVDADASAVFGQATVSLTSRVSATAGLRYTHERKTIDNAGGLYTADAPSPCFRTRTVTRTPSRTTRGRRSSAWRCAHANMCSPTCLPRAGSRAVASTPHRPRPAADMARSGRGAMRVD